MREVAPGVHVLGGRKGGRVRAFLLEAAGELTLVDTLFEDDGAVVMAAIRSLGRSLRDLKQIALTHAHRSHLGGVAALKRASGATVLAHEWEADVVSGDRPAQSVGLKPTRPLRTYPFQVGIFLNRPRHVPCAVDEAIDGGAEIGPLETIAAPGHSPGHLGFHWGERSLLLVGDAIAAWPRTEPGWPAFTLNAKQHRQTLARFAAREASIVGVGHGDAITAGAAALLHSFAESA